MTGFWDKENNKLIETSTMGKLATGGVDLTQNGHIAMSDPFSPGSINGRSAVYMGKVGDAEYAVISYISGRTLTYDVYKSTDGWENYSLYATFDGTEEANEYTTDNGWMYGYFCPYDHITVAADGFWHWWLYESQDEGITWTKKGNVPANAWSYGGNPYPFLFTQSWTDGEFAYTICTGDDSDTDWYAHCGVWRRQYDDNTWERVINPRANMPSGFYWQSAPRYVGTFHLDGHSVDLCLMHCDDDDEMGFIGWYRDPDFSNDWKPISTAFYGSFFVAGYTPEVGKNQHIYLYNKPKDGVWKFNGAQVNDNTIVMCGETYGEDWPLSRCNCVGGMMVLKYNSTTGTFTVTREMVDSSTAANATYGPRPYYNIYSDDNYVYALRGLFWYGSSDVMGSAIYYPRLWVAKKNEDTINWKLIYSGSQNQRMGRNWFSNEAYHYYINNYHIFVGFPDLTSSVPNVQLMVKDGVVYQNTLGQRIGVVPRDPLKDVLYKISDNVWLSQVVSSYSQNKQNLISRRPATIEGNKIYQMVCTASDVGTVYYTIDGGMKWFQLNIPTGGNFIDVDFSPLFGEVQDVDGDGLVTKAYLQAVLSYIVNNYEVR